MNIKILKPLIWSISVLVLLYIILFSLELIFNSRFGFNKHIFEIFWPITAIIFFSYNYTILNDIYSLDSKEKRNVIISITLACFIALLYWIISIYFGSYRRENILPLLSVSVLSSIFFLYFTIYSLLLCKKEIYTLSFIDFLASIAVYILGFISIVTTNNGSILGYYSGIAWGLLIFYIIVWTIAFFVIKSSHRRDNL